MCTGSPRLGAEQELTIHHQEWGRGAPVIALHPLALESTAFGGVAHVLDELGLRTLAVDLPGFGRTPAPGGPLTPAALAPSFARVERHLKVKPIRDDEVNALNRLIRGGAEKLGYSGFVTRHNREGYTVMVEVEADNEWRLAKGLAQEYGIARYHRLETVLRYQPMARTQRPIVATFREKQQGMTVRFELIGTEREPLYVRVEDEDIDTLHTHVTQQFGLDIDALDLRKRLEKVLMREDGFVVELNQLQEALH